MSITPLSGVKQVTAFMSEARYLMSLVSRGQNEDWEQCGKLESDLKNSLSALSVLYVLL